MNDLHDQYTVTCEEYYPDAWDLKEYKERMAEMDRQSDDKYGVVCARDTDWE